MYNRSPFIVVEAFVESGVLYLIVQLVVVATFITRSPAKDIALSAASQIYVCYLTTLACRAVLTFFYSLGHCPDNDHCPCDLEQDV